MSLVVSLFYEIYFSDGHFRCPICVPYSIFKVGKTLESGQSLARLTTDRGFKLSTALSQFEGGRKKKDHDRDQQSLMVVLIAFVNLTKAYDLFELKAGFEPLIVVHCCQNFLLILLAKKRVRSGVVH